MLCAGVRDAGRCAVRVWESNPRRPPMAQRLCGLGSCRLVHAARLDGYQLTSRLFEQIRGPLGLLDPAVELAPLTRQVVGLPPQGAHVHRRQDPDLGAAVALLPLAGDLRDLADHRLGLAELHGRPILAGVPSGTWRASSWCSPQRLPRPPAPPRSPPPLRSRRRRPPARRTPSRSRSTRSAGQSSRTAGTCSRRCPSPRASSVAAAGACPTRTATTPAGSGWGSGRAAPSAARRASPSACTRA